MVNKIASAYKTMVIVMADDKKECEDIRRYLQEIGGFMSKISFSVEDIKKTVSENGALYNILIYEWQARSNDCALTIQKMREAYNNDVLGVLLINNAVPPEDLFLMEELDVFNHIQKGVATDAYLEKVNHICLEQEKYRNIHPKLHTLKMAISTDDSKQVEDLLKDDTLMQELKSNVRLNHLLGEAYITKHNLKEAIAYLKDILQKEPGKTETLKILSTLGKAMCLSGMYNEALLIYDRLAAKSPRNFSHNISCGDALLGMNKVSEAKEKYSKVLKEDAQNKNAMAGLGKAAIVEGKVEEAKSIFASAGGNMESYALASFFNNRAVALVRSGKVVDAISLYENALGFLNKYKGHIYFNLGLAHLRSGSRDRAEKCFSEASKCEDADFLAKKAVVKIMNIPLTKSKEDMGIASDILSNSKKNSIIL